MPGEFHGVLNHSVPPALIWAGCFLTLFFVVPLEELLVLPQALAEFFQIDILVVGIHSYSQTGSVGRPSCRTPVLILFNIQL